jgi:hypothetical protein
MSRNARYSLYPWQYGPCVVVGFHHRQEHETQKNRSKLTLVGFGLPGPTWCRHLSVVVVEVHVYEMPASPPYTIFGIRQDAKQASMTVTHSQSIYIFQTREMWKCHMFVHSLQLICTTNAKVKNAGTKKTSLFNKVLFGRTKLIRNWTVADLPVSGTAMGIQFT